MGIEKMYAVYPGSELQKMDRYRYKELYVALVPIHGLLGSVDEICSIFKDENKTTAMSNKDIIDYLGF